MPMPKAQSVNTLSDAEDQLSVAHTSSLIPKSKAFSCLISRYLHRKTHSTQVISRLANPVEHQQSAVALSAFSAAPEQDRKEVFAVEHKALSVPC